MAVTVKVLEAKTHLSALLVRVENGEEITICRGDVPVARLTSVRRESRELGFAPYRLPVAFFDELPDDELAAWE